jgi:23S rRNA (adenine2503-C2)-methyltransferase
MQLIPNISASDTKLNLYDLCAEQMVEFAKSIGESGFRGHQIASWLFQKGVTEFAEMTNISRKIADKISSKATAQSLVKPVSVDQSPDDGSVRILWELMDKKRVESVILPERNHLTLCLSTQVGCRMGCRFCRTGTLGLVRHLTSGEILCQILEARKIIDPKKSPHRLGFNHPITNLVFMGMGDPLDNAENTHKSIDIITNPGYLSFSMHHVTISTVGVLPELKRLASAKSLKVSLAISLGSAIDEVRSEIMPINRAWPLTELKEVLLNFPLPSGRRLSFAYVLLKDVNDTPKQALAFSRFLSGLKAKVNLIPFNPWPGAPFQRPSDETVEAFKKVLTDKYHCVFVRDSKGQSIGAACGQLAAQTAGKPD